MSAFAEFHFLRPLWLLLLLAVPAFWLLRRHGRADAGAWRSVIDPHLLPHLIERIDAGSGRAGIVLAVALWTVACCALAGPAWEREPMPLYRNQAARVLALELGATMMAQDEKPTRFERARYKLIDILDRSKDYQTALIGYAGEAFVAAPLTDDIGTVRNLVDSLDPSTMPVAGNRAAGAIEQAENLIGQAGLHAGDIILLADSADDAAIAAARRAHAQGLTVSVLGIGSPAGAPVALAQGDFLKDDAGNVIVSRRDDASLKAVADAGGGRYATLSADARDIASLLVDRTSAARNASDPSTPASSDLAASTRWRDRGPWLLLLLLPLAAFAFRRGWMMAIALAALAPAPRAQAASFKDLWMRSDQQAAAALEQGDAKTAASVARSPDWHGGASFRAGDYTSAASDYANVDGADGAYNEGNALAKLGRFDDALAAYDRALTLAPDMDDAKANKSAVEEWLKRQQKSKDKSSQNQKSKSGDSKDQKQSQQDKSQQSQDQKQQSDESKSDQDQQDQKDEGSSQSDQDADEKEKQSDSQQKAGEEKDKQQSSQGTEGSTTEPQSQMEPSEGKPSNEQQQALSKAIDQSLASGAKASKHDKPAAAVEEDNATQEKRQALEHLLQRVPDDPGGLLRRKFLLEHQRRQQHGDDNG
ncbi:MAG TPA: VWA domain-containing protein [Rhodanobacteraceae bacterium]|jgi:Ca-activated chloride channel family protein|nr:VWA domain-containing protein [Rhodanobacteraceae bacterium]